MNVSKRAVDAIYDVNKELYKAGNAAQLLCKLFLKEQLSHFFEPLLI